LTGGVTDSDHATVKAMQSIKIIKLLRMLKLARVVKASRVLKRFLEDVFMSKFEVRTANSRAGRRSRILSRVPLLEWLATRSPRSSLTPRACLLCATRQMTFAAIKVMKLSGILILIAHWQACIFALVPGFLTNQPTWVGNYVENERLNGIEVSGGDIYVASLYWSIMTLTSIGYGDFVPANTIERALSCLYMAVSVRRAARLSSS
jgi:hypothetical protein